MDRPSKESPRGSQLGGRDAEPVRFRCVLCRQLREHHTLQCATCSRDQLSLLNQKIRVTQDRVEALRAKLETRVSSLQVRVASQCGMLRPQAAVHVTVQLVFKDAHKALRSLQQRALILFAKEDIARKLLVLDAKTHEASQRACACVLGVCAQLMPTFVVHVCSAIKCGTHVSAGKVTGVPPACTCDRSQTRNAHREGGSGDVRLACGPVGGSSKAAKRRVGPTPSCLEI